MRPEDWPAALGTSFRTLTGADLLLGADPLVPGYDARLMAAPFPIVAHGIEADPIFAWANTAALALWEMDFAAFTRMPSRLSAADDAGIQADRSRYLAEAREKGWVADYCGTRQSASGRRFVISDTVLWTVSAGDRMIGQAARIGRVER